MSDKKDSRADEGYHFHMGWYHAGLVFWGLVFRRYCQLRVQGREYIPKGGPAVVTANHMSLLDPFLVGMILNTPHPIAFMGKKELFANPVLRWIIQGWGAFPVDRARKDASSLRTALAVLKAGEILGMFPEGTRSTTGELQELRTGALRLAIRTRAPMIPVGIAGTDRAMPRGARFPRPVKITVTFGPPLDLSALHDHRPTDMEIEHYSEELRKELDRLHHAGMTPW